VEREVKSRFESQQGRSPSKEELNTALDNVSIADLSEIGIRRGGLKTATKRAFLNANIIEGRDFLDPTFIREAFNLQEAELEGGGTVPDFLRPSSELPTAFDQREDFLTPQRQAVDDLLGAAIGQINQGIDLIQGNLSSPLGRDFATQFNELFTSPLAAAGTARSGEAEFARSIGARTAAFEFGQQVLGSGINLLNTADPFALPGAQVDLINQNFQQNTFKNMFALGQQNQAAAIRQLEVQQKHQESAGNTFVNLLTGIVAGQDSQGQGSGGGILGLG
jgi:hypothetical protein